MLDAATVRKHRIFERTPKPIAFIGGAKCLPASISRRSRSQCVRKTAGRDIAIVRGQIDLRARDLEPVAYVHARVDLTAERGVRLFLRFMPNISTNKKRESGVRI
jgi:hypothetical protein